MTCVIWVQKLNIMVSDPKLKNSLAIMATLAIMG